MAKFKFNVALVLIISQCSVGSCSFLGFFKGPEVLRTPDERFENLALVGYPWEPKYTEFQLDKYPKLRVHYIDEGPKTASETILLLHGTPAWSFLYRKVIPILIDKGYRIIAPDFIGTGRSDKLTDIARYTHELHVQTLQHLIDKLDLKDMTLVGHDLGGPIGGSVLKTRANRFKNIALLNTWFPQGDVFSSISRAIQHIPYLSWRVTTKMLGLFHPVSAVFLVATQATFLDVLHGYKAPFPDHRYKAGLAAWPPMIPLYPDELLAKEMQGVATFLKSWTGKSMVVYSSNELFTLPGRALLEEEVFPDSCKITVPDAGHFLQEDQWQLVADIIVEFVKGSCKVLR